MAAEVAAAAALQLSANRDGRRQPAEGPAESPGACRRASRAAPSASRLRKAAPQPHGKGAGSDPRHASEARPKRPLTWFGLSACRSACSRGSGDRGVPPTAGPTRVKPLQCCSHHVAICIRFELEGLTPDILRRFVGAASGARSDGLMPPFQTPQMFSLQLRSQRQAFRLLPVPASHPALPVPAPRRHPVCALDSRQHSRFTARFTAALIIGRRIGARALAAHAGGPCSGGGAAVHA